jgi:3-deoxy-D-manno-octulosonate 8-phosphate phosphatase KdsC-like HAD superfamily phosphatase
MNYLGAEDKVANRGAHLAREGVTWEACAMVGDDSAVVPLMRRVGWRFAVATPIRASCRSRTP